MGILYSYECVRADNVRPIETVGDKRVVLADLQFRDENDRLFAPAKDVLVAIDAGGNAEVVDYPENLLPDGTDDATWDKWVALLDKYPAPDHEVDNPEEFSALFAG